jgi:hypothetical protein
MSDNNCNLCRFTCKNLLINCQLYAPDRRKQTRAPDVILKHAWENIYTDTTSTEPRGEGPEDLKAK